MAIKEACGAGVPTTAGRAERKPARSVSAVARNLKKRAQPEKKTRR